MTEARLTRRTALKLAGVATAGLAAVGRGQSAYADVPAASPVRPGALPRPDSTRVFLDPSSLASSSDVSRVAQQGTKSGVLLRPDRPWEQGLGANVYLYGNVVFDESAHMYKMWYHTYDDKQATAQYMTMYAESRDGISWVKPNLGVYSYNGSKNNNIIAASVGDGNARHLPSVILDSNAPAAERYKMLCYTYSGSGTPWGEGYSAWVSPDGINWSPVDHEPIAPGADVITLRFDPVSGRYIALLKIYPASGRRTVFMSYSTDFATWSDPVQSLPPDSIDDALAVASGWDHGEIYGMGAGRYRDCLIGYPWVMYTNARQNDGHIVGGFAVSTDLGKSWDRSDRTAVIPNGPAGAFDAGMVFTASDILIVHDEVRVYYGGWPQTHANNTQAAIGYSSWPVDRLVALSNGGYNVGSITSKPIVVSQSDLIVNARVKGGLTAQLVDASGAVIPGFEFANSSRMTGDASAHVMTWNDASVKKLAGSTVQVMFKLDDGDLFAYSI